MEDYPEVSAARLDLLKELANIGLGNATTALSRLLNDEKIDMDVPEVAVVPLQDITDYLDDEETIVAVFFEAESDEMSLVLMFVLSLDSAMSISEKLLHYPPVELGEMEQSALMEIGNIIAGSYLNALAYVTNVTFMPTTPSIAVDMGGAILATVIAETMLVDDYLILLLTDITTEGQDISGSIFILPDYGSLKRIFKLMGVE